MVPYNKMYAILCAAASEALDALIAGNATAAALKLREALDQTEELYADTCEE